MIRLVDVVVAPIALYRRVLSPLLPPRCKYHPSCSAYAVDSLRSFGILRGGALAIWRLLRCNPWSLGGYDPVPAASESAEAVRHTHRTQ